MLVADALDAVAAEAVVEQQGKTVEELNALWYGTEFADVQTQAAAIDELITAFNEEAAK